MMEGFFRIVGYIVIIMLWWLDEVLDIGRFVILGGFVGESMGIFV